MEGTPGQVGFLFLDLDQQIINLIGFVETSTLLLDDLLDGIRLNPAHARMIGHNVICERLNPVFQG